MTQQGRHQTEIPPPEVMLTGLSAADVAERVAAGRANDMPLRSGRSLGQIIRANVFTRINAMIAVLFAIIAIIGPVQDGLFALVIVINTLIGIVQELRAKRTLDKLAIVSAARPRVVRDGHAVEVSLQDVVQDDLVDFAQGDQAVVDGEVITTSGLEVDESLLTGESEPVHKRPGDAVMSGSFVVAGQGMFRATRVGRASYAARLTEEASRYAQAPSELRTGVNRILRVITWLLFPTGGLLIYSQLFGHGHAANLVGESYAQIVSGPIGNALRGMVAGLVSMIPEGLVLLISIALAVGVLRLARRRCLVQELPAIEGLARVDVVCADKTGTLTEAGMRVASVVEVGAENARETRPEVDAPERTLAALAAADPRPNLSMAAIAEAYPEASPWPVTAIAMFSSERRWSGTSFQTEEGERHWVIGAPDALVSREDPAAVRAEELASTGVRVLLLGRTEARVDPARPPLHVRPVALVVLEQRIRADAASTLAYFRDQGVEVKVISGDTPTAVGAVARELGLPRADSPIDARDLPDDPDGLARAVDEGSVFGRVTPERKREMVRALRSQGHTVAMTGDGVNDVLALKESDIGVAMGSGSPASRSISQLVLLDNRFATLPRVVAEGRRVVGNIERVANLFLTKTIYSITMVSIVSALSLVYPFFPRHATLINAVTFGIPSFFLALAPNIERARPGFVRRTLRLAVPSGVIAGLATMVTYLLVLENSGAPDLGDRTAALITLCVVTMWVLLVVAKPYVWWKVALVGAMATALTGVMLVPFARAFFALDVSDPSKVSLALTVGAVGALLVTVVRIVDDRFLSDGRGVDEPALSSRARGQTGG